MARGGTGEGTGAGAVMWAEGLACGALVALLPPTALLLGVLLAPVIVALMLDHEPGKPVGRSVALCALAAAVGPVRALWAAGHTLTASLVLLGDLSLVGTVWSAAAAGWLLAELAPLLTRVALEAISRSRAARLRAARAKLVEEWGLEGDAGPSPGPMVGERALSR
jgi:hypothetical protein